MLEEAEVCWLRGGIAVKRCVCSAQVAGLCAFCCLLALENGRRCGRTIGPAKVSLLIHAFRRALGGVVFEHCSSFRALSGIYISCSHSLMQNVHS
jgi:hypothetical protein